MNKKLDDNLTNRLKELRLEHNYSQKYVAEQLNISRQAISKWENGRSYPDIDNLRLLSSLYNVSLDSFFQKNINEIEDTKIEESKSNMISKGFLILFIISVISYFVSPFGLILIPIILLFIRKISNYKLIIYGICLVSLLRNGQDLYYLLNSNPENEVITIEEVDD